MTKDPNFITISTSVRFPVKRYSDKRVMARFWMAEREMAKTGEQIIREHLKAVERMYE